MSKRLPLSPGFLALVVALSFAACVDDDEKQPVSSNGTVVFNHIEGGFYGIVDKDGQKWDPENLPDALAIDSLEVSFQGVPTDDPTFHMWGRTLHLTGVNRVAGPPEVDLDPFLDLARNADCADRRNRLYLIDECLVFWDRESSCADASYARTLYGRTISHLMCTAEDTIAGPRQTCSDRDSYAEMFKIILDNLEKEDLGLGPSHTVKPVEF